MRAKYRNADEKVWEKEEPKNMVAYGFMSMN